MRIEELLLRTMKSDQNPNEGRIDHYMQRAGFIKKINGRTVHTKVGLLLKSRIEKVIMELLESRSYSQIGFTGVQSLLELEEAVHSFNDSYVGSYKDIPLKLYAQEQISFRNGNYDSSWRENAQNVVMFSVLGKKWM